VSDPGQLHQRETDFHDRWADDTDLDSIALFEAFEAPTAVENQYILGLIGPLEGKRLLDVGAGLGESSVYFALKGARVTTTDISPRMVETALALGKKHGALLEGFVTTGEGLNVEPESYDIVYLANVIHHVHDRAALYGQVVRALKPGGRFFSIDPVAYNPVINQYRRMATEVRTPDETPLATHDVRLARSFFPDIEYRHFWIATLLLFIKYAMMDRVHPNQDRYWKRILRETDATLRWWKPLLGLDRMLTRIPGLRWWSWNIVMHGTKPRG
jgi:2-polyprenyl-3-methyl-5-hydroxy-6-metoxy-1,4-benzoquinol methylase